MRLIPKSIAKTIPNIGETEGQGAEAIAYVKLYHPRSEWTWYITEFDGEDLCFGLVQGFEEEFGYFSLKELESVKDDWGLGIERDLYYEPCPVRQVMKKKAGGYI